MSEQLPDDPEVTIVMPTIAARSGTYRRRATRSIERQTAPTMMMRIEDKYYAGPAAVRNTALRLVETEWVGFLDDDDVLYPEHVEKLLAKAKETDADLVYPWFDGPNAEGILELHGRSPEGWEFGSKHRQWLLDVGNFLPITVLARTSMLRNVGGFPEPGDPDIPGTGDAGNEDWGLWRRLLLADAKFVHLPERTWMWRVHGQNTSGMPQLARRLEAKGTR